MRKLVIDEMGQSMLAHEKEEADLAQKLTLMKNQIMENDTGFGMSKRYGCVRKGWGGLQSVACTVSKHVLVFICSFLDIFHQRRW